MPNGPNDKKAEIDQGVKNLEAMKNQIKERFVTARKDLRSHIEGNIKSDNKREKTAIEAIINKNTEWLINSYEKEIQGQLFEKNITELNELDQEIQKVLGERTTSLKAYITNIAAKYPQQNQEIINKLANKDSLENIVSLSWALKNSKQYRDMAFIAKWSVGVDPEVTSQTSQKSPTDILKSREQQKEKAFKIIAQNIDSHSDPSKRDVALFTITNLSSDERVEFGEFYFRHQKSQPLNNVLDTLLSRPGLYSPSEIESIINLSLQKQNKTQKEIDSFKKGYLTAEKNNVMAEQFSMYHKTMDDFKNQQLTPTPGSSNIFRDATGDDLLKFGLNIWLGTVAATNIIASGAIGAKDKKGLGRITGALKNAAGNVYGMGSLLGLAVLNSKDGIEGIFRSTPEKEAIRLMGQELAVAIESPKVRPLLIESGKTTTAVSSLREYLDNQRILQKLSKGAPLKEEYLTPEKIMEWMEKSSKNEHQSLANKLEKIAESPKESESRKEFQKLISIFSQMRSYNADPEEFINTKILKIK